VSTPRLIPGYAALADAERARQASIVRIECLPWAPSFAAGGIHLVATAADAAAWAERLHGESVSMLGVDTEFGNGGPKVVLRGGRDHADPSLVRPIVCSVAVWCGAGRGAGGPGDHMIRLVYDLRRPEVYTGLADVLAGLHVPWIAHSAQAEYQCLWACVVEPPEHLLVDTRATACCLNLGRFHRRQPIDDPAEAVARARQLREKSAHATSLVGQCAHYGIPHPFALAKGEMQRRFLTLGRDETLTDMDLAYAASDAEYALRLHLAQAADVHRIGLLPHLATVEWPLVAAVARMELAGLPIDRERAARYREACLAIAREMADRLAAFGIVAGSRDSFLKAMARADVLGRFVRDDKPSTTRETLRECERLGVHPAVGPFRLHEHFRALADSEFLTNRIVAPDGRLRGSLDPIGSASGRIASSRPNTIGLDARLRPVVAAPPGRVMLEVDLSQIEVGLAGAEWGDADLVDLFNRGDSYAAIAQSFYRAELREAERALSSSEFRKARPDLRDRVKALVLGMLYGRGAAGIAESFGCPIDHAEAELARFFDHFPRVRDGAERAVRASLRRSYGVAATGLRRQVEPGDLSMSNALRNHPIQSVAAAIFKAAIVRIDRHFRGTTTRILLPRHDSLLVETPEGTEDEVEAACRLIMVDEVRAIYPQLRPTVKVERGRHWPTGKTLEDFYRREGLGELAGAAPAGPAPVAEAAR
jgi:DNA polymerase I-like protein with 3'-5' exonuclease and polymerase domains